MGIQQWRNMHINGIKRKNDGGYEVTLSTIKNDLYMHYSIKKRTIWDDDNGKQYVLLGNGKTLLF